jgi:hypothetical protein
LRQTSVRCQILFVLFWLDWSQRLHREVAICVALRWRLTFRRYQGMFVAVWLLQWFRLEALRHIALLWILRVRCKCTVIGGSRQTILGLSVVSWAATQSELKIHTG